MFREIDPQKLSCAPFDLIGNKWLLICAPDAEKHSGANAMTASWGGLGVIWNKNVATVYVRPQRHTFTLMENGELCSLCFLGQEFRDALKLCGTKTGKNMDKIQAAGLDVCFEDGVPVIEQSDLVLICKKAYSDFLKEDYFNDPAHLSSYPNKDFHKMYILEIKKILVKQ